jgi:hypothetical protein
MKVSRRLGPQNYGRDINFKSQRQLRQHQQQQRQQNAIERLPDKETNHLTSASVSGTPLMVVTVVEKVLGQTPRDH